MASVEAGSMDAEVVRPPVPATSFLTTLHVPELNPPVRWACNSCHSTKLRDVSACLECRNTTIYKTRAYIPMKFRPGREK